MQFCSDDRNNRPSRLGPMAVMNRKPAAGLIMHSDRGAQYAFKDFREKLEKHKMIQSMSGTGNC
ncbi:MAG: hypothetical protein WCK32_06105 [Chlorobiaceae bacterium]